MLFFIEQYQFFNTHNLLVSNIFRIFAGRFCISYVKIQKNWFILVHFTKSLFLFFFVAYRAASILALASSTSELLMERR